MVSLKNASLSKSYDIIGSKGKAVAIIESSTLKQEKELAQKIMKQHPSVKSVLKKVSERRGKLRKRKYALVKGSINTTVFHKEYGYILKLDPKQTYFSPRELTERQRLASLMKSKESVLVMFSGISPIPIAIEKKQPQIKEIYAIELNKKAHEFAEENIKINRCKKIKLIQGDVREVLLTLRKKFDHIIMPLPKGAHLFLSLVFKKIKNKGVIHFYHWGREEDLFNKAIEIFKKEAKKSNKRIKILRKKKVLPYAPRVWKIVLDGQIINQ